MQVEHGVVGRVLLLEGHDLLGHGDDPERECDTTALALIAHLLDPGLRLLLWLRVPVAVEGPHERAALLQVELLHLEGRTHVQVDRAGVNGGVRPRGLDVADHLAAARPPRSKPSPATPSAARSARRDSRARAAGSARRARAARPAARAAARAPPSVGRTPRRPPASAAARRRPRPGAPRGSARTRGRGSPAPRAARGTRSGGGRRTGRARPRRPRTSRGPGCGVRPGPTSGAGSPPCPGRSRRAPRRGRRRRCRARARWWPRPPADRPPRGAARSRAAAPACSRRGRARCAPPGRCRPASSSRWRAKRWISSTPRRDFRKQIVRISRSTSSASRFAASDSAEARRPRRSSTSGGFHIAIWRSARGAPSRSTSCDLHSREPLGELGRVRDRGAREQEARVAAVGAREPAQAAQHVRHVRAEHTAVHVRLVHDDPGEVREHVSPRAVVRQDADVEHVRVREDQVRALPDRAPLLARRVAVVDGLAQVLAAEPVARRARPRAWSCASAFVG